MTEIEMDVLIRLSKFNLAEMEFPYQEVKKRQCFTGGCKKKGTHVLYFTSSGGKTVLWFPCDQHVEWCRDRGWQDL